MVNSEAVQPPLKVWPQVLISGPISEGGEPMVFRREGGSKAKGRHPAGSPLSPFARPDGTCLGRLPEEEHEKEVPAAPADPEAPPADPAEPMNPA